MKIEDTISITQLKQIEEITGDYKTPYDLLMKIKEAKNTLNLTYITIEDYLIRKFDEFFTYDFDNSSGVYFLNDFYIGKSNDLMSRMISHLKETIYPKRNKNSERNLKIISSLKKDKICVSLLSEDVSDEAILINKYNSTHNLTNKILYENAK